MTARSRFIAALLLLATRVPAQAGEQYDALMKSDHLACIHLDDAVNLIHFMPTDQFPTFRSFLLGVQETDRCVWWRKGDRLIVSGRDYYGAEDVVAARRPPDSLYWFIDKCYVEGVPCP